MMQDFRGIVQQHLSEADTEGAIQAGAEDQHGISDLSQAHTTFDHSQQDIKLCSKSLGNVLCSKCSYDNNFLGLPKP